MYDRELDLTADSEAGVQILFDSPWIHADAWVNWESFIFKKDTHNEVFTAGGSFILRDANPKSFYWEVPLQALAIHRGGEINEVSEGVLSLANVAAGLRVGFNLNHPFIKNISAEVLGTAYRSLQMPDEYLPYENGWGIHSKLSMKIKNLSLKMLYWHGDNYVSLLGSPIFGTVSTTREGLTFSRVSVFNPGIRYEQEFGSGYYLGADLDFYYNPKLRQYTNLEAESVTSTSSNSWSMGIYLRINPSLILKKYAFNNYNK